jgi:hypothetical protein
MGCDIHSYAEKKNKDGAWERISNYRFFEWRSYGVFGFLADVRNYSAVKPISKPRGLPKDISKEVFTKYEMQKGDAHTASWLSVGELTSFNYEELMEDRRVAVQLAPRAYSGGETTEKGKGIKITFRQFLGEKFFDDLEKLKSSGAERLVFWFDN